MKLRLIYCLLLLLCCFGNTIQAQNISQQDYEELVDEIICEFTTLSLKEQKGQIHYKTFQTEIVNQRFCNYYKIRPFLRDRTPIPTKTLEIVNILHNEYKSGYDQSKSNNQHYLTLINIFDEEKIQVFAENHPTSYPGFKTDLEGYIREVLNLDINVEPDVIAITSEEDLDTTTEAVAEREIIQPTVSIPEPYSTNSNSSQWLFWGLLLILLAIIAYFIYGFLMKNKGRKTNYAATNTDSSNKGSALQNKVDEQKEKLEGLMGEVENLHNQLNKFAEMSPDDFKAYKEKQEPAQEESEESKEEEEGEKEVVTELIEEEETPVTTLSDEIPDLTNVKFRVRPEHFYMPAPNAEGSFETNTWKSNFEASESVYSFEMIGATEAKFHFYDNENAVLRAFNDQDKYIYPVCKPLNEYNEGATKIITQVPGIVFKDGDEWKLKEKALIYFE
ncbi:MAG: hypothetical protein ACPG19_11735 [Saprospiraceae bacterium]